MNENDDNLDNLSPSIFLTLFLTEVGAEDNDI